MFSRGGKKRTLNRLTTGILLLLTLYGGLLQAEERLRLATTTSTDNTGLLATLHPPFESQYGVKIDVIAVGTGKALRLGKNGDVDLVMVHAPEAEQQFVDQGYGVARLPVMHNDFVLLGPPQDPASVKTATGIAEALQLISKHQAPFISRGDDSGTHKKEMSLWTATGVKPTGHWYLAAGQGMGAVIKIADDKRAYTLADRGTFLAFRDKISLTIVSAGTRELFNPYHVILVNEKRHPHVKTALAQSYADYIRGPQGQGIIRDFRKSGEPLFKPDVIH